MRRRLLLTTDAVGGVWTYSLDLARALAEAEDMVITMQATTTAEEPAATEEVIEVEAADPPGENSTTHEPPGV